GRYLHVRHERAEHDPGAEPARDHERVLSVEAHAGPDGGLPVDVLVRVNEHPVGPAETLAEGLQLRPQVAVAVGPGIARERPLARPGPGARRVVAERGGDNRTSTGKERLRMTGL